VAKLYDYVELTAPAGDWPAGARGHLIEIYPNGMGLVEIEGATESADAERDFVPDVALSELRVLAPARPR